MTSMKNKYFVIREIGEVFALKIILDFLIEKKSKINFKIIISSINTDFYFINIKKILSKYRNITITKKVNIENSQSQVFWFKWNVIHENDKYITDRIDIYEISTCDSKLIKRKPIFIKNQTPTIVVWNLKVNDKDINEECSPKTFDILWNLNYNVIIVPRHPIKTLDYLVNLPSNIIFSNTMWKLRQIYSTANLTIMGKIFSNTKDDRDHNPLESTIQSNSISWIYSFTHKSYLPIYKSWLITKLKSFEEIPYVINDLIYDKYLSDKLERRNRRIEKNRKEYLNYFLYI